GLCFFAAEVRYATAKAASLPRLPDYEPCMTMPFQPAAFPYARPRRLRSQPWVRRLVAETTLTPADLIWPLIVHDGSDDRQAVPCMPGVFRLAPREAAKAAVEARDLGSPRVALFPKVAGANKDSVR